MADQPKTVDDARRLLRAAIKSSRYNVLSLTLKLFRNRRGRDFIRDFLSGRKEKLGGASETAMVERELKLEPGSLAVVIDIPDDEFYQGSESRLNLIEEAMRAAVVLVAPRHSWVDEDFEMAARLFREFFADKRFAGEDLNSRRMQLEIAIRRAFQRDKL